MNRKSFLNRLFLGTAAIGLAKVSSASEAIKPIVSENKLDTFGISNKSEAVHPKYKNYKADRFGNIYSSARRGTRSSENNLLKINKGYVRISNNGNTKTLKANRIIYECFNDILIKSQSLIIIHKDGNTNNLSIDNLQLVNKKGYEKYKPTKKAIRESNGRLIRWV